MGGRRPPSHGDRPNVPLFVTDDARAETLHQMPKTRRWLADGGGTFTQAYAPTPSCCPSRASIFSGRYVHNHGVHQQRQGARLDQTGEPDRTLVFLSDNGYAWGEHRHVGKFVPYTESTRIPFLVRWPGCLPAGSVDDRLVATIDIKPTVLGAAGVDPDAGDTVDGRSLLGSQRRERLLPGSWRDPASAPPSLGAELAAARGCVGATCP
jgi:arylsulfatase A-like enzyme